MVRRLGIIQQNGAEDRYFRYEGSINDRVMGLPSHIDTSELRLYCLNISHKVLIVGNGGIKNTRTYDEDADLSGYVITLQKLDALLKEAIRKGIVSIEETNITGTENSFEL